VSWLRFFKRGTGDEPAQAAPPKSGNAAGQAAGKPKSEPGSGYGANPYDTYTWELHTEPDGERQLKRAHLIDSRPKQDSESFNPYDTGKFSGGW
jgi:hypothetical protein